MGGGSHQPGLGRTGPEQGAGRWRGRLKRAGQEGRQPLVDPPELAQSRTRHGTCKAPVGPLKGVEQL